MTAYQKLFNLVFDYLGKKLDAGESDNFCNKYLDMYYDLSDELEAQVSPQVFTAFDKINLICDAFEICPEIRADAPYCIDEKQLNEKIKSYIPIISMIGGQDDCK